MRHRKPFSSMVGEVGDPEVLDLGLFQTKMFKLLHKISVGEFSQKGGP